MVVAFISSIIKMQTLVKWYFINSHSTVNFRSLKTNCGFSSVPSPLKSCHEQGPPFQAEEICGQEVIIEVK